jgi:PIN domain nuclease of toxin-antitoxin system
MRRISLARTRSRSSSPLLLDTHIWLWETAANPQLSHSIRRLINEASQTGQLRLSAISIWEISLLASGRKIRLGMPVPAWIAEARERSHIILEPVSGEIALEAGNLPGGFRSDPADQIIVATARLTNATLLTRDSRILAYAEDGHLNAIAA